MTFDLIIRNGTVFDGSANEGRKIDIGITEGVISAIDDLSKAVAGRVIDAGGKYVTPGFIDIQNHSDSYFTLFEIPSLLSLVTQGITTIAVGHCGSSLAPLTGPDSIKSSQSWHSIAGANINWQTFDEFLQNLENYDLGVNVVSLIGHNTMRRGLIGDQLRPATPQEVKIMESALERSLEEGGAGLSLGMVYSNEAEANIAELNAVAAGAVRRKKLISVHLRSEGAQIGAAVSEVAALAEKHRARVKISHFKVRGKANWPLLEQALAEIDRAYQRGIDISFDVYPYTTTWTVLYTFLPKWAYEGGKTEIVNNLRDPGKRAKMLAYLRDLGQDLGSIFISTSETNPGLVGKTISQVAANQEISVEEAMLNVLVATDSQAVVFDRNLSDENLITILKHPLSLVATDGSGYDFNFHPQHGLVHPRCFGAMPKFLGMVRDKKLMNWAEAVKKITSRPAEKLGLQKRGRLEKGFIADIVIFNPEKIGSQAVYENPYQEADGIDEVLIGGKTAHSSMGPEKEMYGKVIRI